MPIAPLRNVIEELPNEHIVVHGIILEAGLAN
jgi:hypothetical protein